MSRLRTALAVLTLTGVAAAGVVMTTTSQPQAAATAATPRTLLLSAFGDSKGTFGETKPYVNRLNHRVDRSGDSAYCEFVVEGNLSGHPVVVAATGTGEQNAAGCTQELLQWYSPQITEVIWSGIGGVTPAVGGLYDVRGQRRKNAQPVMLGDVCITSLAWNYDLHFSSVTGWKSQRTQRNRYGASGGWWSMRNSRGKALVPGFQDVPQFEITKRGLAEEITQAAASVTWPRLGPKVRNKIERFFPRSRIRDTRVFDNRQCAEVSGDNFWHGTVEDALARDYTARLINASGVRASRADARNVIVLSAMEGSGWTNAVARWNRHNHLTIPMAIVRAASNYDQVPLTRGGLPVRGKNGQRVSAMQDIRLGFRTAGADLAIDNAARPVLAMLQSRVD